MPGLPLAVATAILLGMVSCAPPPRTVPIPPPAPQDVSPPESLSQETPASAENVLLAPSVVEFARTLLGTPYRYSGSDPSGFDCSGFSYYVFASVGVELPRRASDQVVTGSWVPLDELVAGDLVFFGATRLNPHHVGVVSSGPGEPLRMIHASSSLGVVETEVLSSSYWLDRLEQGRRVLPRE